MKNRYEKVGAIIYGVNHLKATLQTLNSWFKEQNTGKFSQISDLTISTKDAEEFFTNNPRLNEIKSIYISFSNELCTWSNSLNLNADTSDAELNNKLLDLHKLHNLAAEIVNEFSVPGLLADALRKKGSSLLELRDES